MILNSFNFNYVALSNTILFCIWIFFILSNKMENFWNIANLRKSFLILIVFDLNIFIFFFFKFNPNYFFTLTFKKIKFSMFFVYFIFENTVNGVDEFTNVYHKERHLKMVWINETNLKFCPKIRSKIESLAMKILILKLE